NHIRVSSTVDVKNNQNVNILAGDGGHLIGSSGGISAGNGGTITNLACEFALTWDAIDVRGGIGGSNLVNTGKAGSGGATSGVTFTALADMDRVLIRGGQGGFSNTAGGSGGAGG